MVAIIFLKSLCFIFWSIGGALNSFMDMYVRRWNLLPKKEQEAVNANWFSFNPAAKWKGGKFNTEKANNILILKLTFGKWKTKWLADNSNDAWHCFKSLMVVSLAIANVCMYFFGVALYGIGDLLIIGVAWIVPFDIILNWRVKK